MATFRGMTRVHRPARPDTAAPTSSPAPAPKARASTNQLPVESPARDRFAGTLARAPAPVHTPISGYDHPIDATELPDPGDGTAVMTLNLANGAGDVYRTAEN